MISPSHERPVDVLLVEDNPGDVRLTQEAFEMAGFDVTIHIATDGKEALAFLGAHRDDPELTYPDLLLLDLNLPRVDGLTVLETVKEDPAYPELPVLILSSSTAIEDVTESYELAANAYLTKPDDPDEFVELARAVESFWIGQAKLPPIPS